MKWDSALEQLPSRLHRFLASDPRLGEMQRGRAEVYVADGAVPVGAIEADGRLVMPEDAEAVHFALDAPMTGGIWWRRVTHSDRAWGGGWWTTAQSKPFDGVLLIVILLAQSLNAGCRYGWSTVTHRHSAHRILAKLGARVLWRWHDPDYLCPMEWVEFDLQAIPDAYRPTVEHVRVLLESRQGS